VQLVISEKDKKSESAQCKTRNWNKKLAANKPNNFTIWQATNVHRWL